MKSRTLGDRVVQAHLTIFTASRSIGRAWNTSTLETPPERTSLREGASLGLVVAATTWIWLAVVDAASGAPFQTFRVLGGIAPFTVIHILLNVAYGVVIVSAIRGASSTPSLVIAVLVGLVMLEIAFAMVTVLLSQTSLGGLAWVGILGGSLIGTAIAVTILARKYPLLALVHEAEEEN